MIGSQVSLRMTPHVTQPSKILGDQQLCNSTGTALLASGGTALQQY